MLLRSIRELVFTKQVNFLQKSGIGNLKFGES